MSLSEDEYLRQAVMAVWDDSERDMKKGPMWEAQIAQFLRVAGVVGGTAGAGRARQGPGRHRGAAGMVIEAKNEQRMTLAEWLDEAERERAAVGAEMAVVWHKRRGRAGAGQGYVTMTGETFARLLNGAHHE